MSSIPIPEVSGLPEKLSTIPPAKLAKTVQAIQKWTGDAFVKIADMVKAVTLAEAQSAVVLEKLTTITTEEQYTEYIQVLKVAKGKAKEFEGTRLEITKPVNDAISRVNDLAKDGKVGWDRVAAKVEGFTATYRIEKQRKADIEAARIRQEQIRLQEVERRKQEALAVKAEAKGNVEQAQAIRETAEIAAAQPVAAVTVEVAVPKVAGAHTRRYWHAAVTNLALVPDRWILKTVNIPGLEDHAKTTEGQVPVPGVAFSFEDKDIVRT